MVSRCYPLLAPIIRNSTRIIPGMAVTTTDTPLCTEIITAKGRIITVTVELMSRIITTINTIAGTMIIQGIAITTEAAIMLEIETMITIAIETIISDLVINNRQVFTATERVLLNYQWLYRGLASIMR